MRFQTVWACAGTFAIAALAGCNGVIGENPSGSGGSGAGSGTGGAGNTGTGGAGNTGTGGAGNTVTGTGGTGGAGGTPVPGQLDLAGAPKYFRAIRLTNTQWAQAVQTVLNVPTSGLEQNFESPISITGTFTNNELGLGVAARNWEDFQSAAETLAAQVTATDTALAKVYTGTDAAGFIATIGRRAYRRPLTTAEKATYMTLYNQGTSLTGTRSAFAKGASLVIRAMLQSPHFVFRTELGPKGAPLNAYEMAAKLSLWLRGTGPDDRTLDLAGGTTAKLDTADGAAALATTMLGEATATTVMRQFHGEWLHFASYADISKVNVPTYKESLNVEYQESSYRFFDNVFLQGLGIKDVLTSTTGFYGPGMAALYGVTAPATGSYTQGDLGAKRVGFFSQLPYLTLNGHNEEPSSILRGVTLNHDVLCAVLGPPAIVFPDIPPLEPGQTNRQRIDKLTGTCGMSCHNDMINPLGFSFEHFDGMGKWRDTENGGLTIDSSGSYTFADGTTKTWTDAAGLMQILASTPQTHTCFAKKLASFGLQRDVVASDMPMLTALTSASMAAATSSEKQMIIQLVRTDAFRTHGGP
jgi:hypothetical protein